MMKFLPLLHEIWREACQHIEIDESVARMAPILARRLPADLVILRRLDLPRCRVDTAAVGLLKPGPAPAQLTTECSSAEIDRLIAWCHKRTVLHARAEEVYHLLPGLLPAGMSGQILAGPLNHERTPAGILLLNASSSAAFCTDDEAVVLALTEPLAVALENDRRLRELAKLREALEADNQSLLSRLGRQDISDAIVGVETGLGVVMERVALVAPSDAPVLVLGETGSGKEVVARAIHRGSRRHSGPFMRVNCGAMPPELIDSELFGHERGGFTGAVSLRKGWFERADGGTLFLDEIGELPAAAQVRLLRILQDGSFERVGGHRQLHADVRVIAATNRDLKTMVASGLFREDLWYRIAVFVIEIPPLRERIQDIPALAAHFALRAAKRLGMSPLVPSAEDNELLVSYDWPGNARELAAVVERAAILGNGRRLDISKALGSDTAIPRAKAMTNMSFNNDLKDPPPETTTLDAVVIRHIEAALTRTRGRIEGPHGAARQLGINPHTLRARMRKLGVDWKTFRLAK